MEEGSAIDSTAPAAAGHYAALVAELADVAGVVDAADEPGRGFASKGLKVHGKLFATLMRDHLLVKLPQRRVAEVIASGDGLPFSTGKGRVMREWTLIPVSAREDWSALAREALEFVGAGATGKD